METKTKTKTGQELTTSFNDDIKGMIHSVRGVQVMLDSDVAKLYGYETKYINRTMKRNIGKFPEDFCFQISSNEYENIIRCQFGTLNQVRNPRFQNGTLLFENGKNIKYLPYAYTEQGIAMLAGLLKNEIANTVSIGIMRAFVEMRKILSNSGSTEFRLSTVENKLLKYDKKFDQVFDALQASNPKTEEVIYKNQFYEAYSFLIDLIKSASSSIIIIDNYIDSFILELICKNTKVDKIIITSKKLKLESLQNVDCEIKIVHNDSFHDRYVIIDNKEVYVFGASLKDLGNKIFAIFKLEDVGMFLKVINELAL
jgi:hypothetical protein